MSTNEILQGYPLPSREQQLHLGRFLIGVLLPLQVVPYSLCLVYPDMFPHLVGITFGMIMFIGAMSLFLGGIALFLTESCFWGGILIAGSVLYILGMYHLSIVIDPYLSSMAHISDSSQGSGLDYLSKTRIPDGLR